MNNKEFLHRDVLKILPWIKPRTLISWSERDLIRPLKSASGRGSERVYSYVNLIEVGILSELLGHGIPFVFAKSILQNGNLKKALNTGRFDIAVIYDRQNVSADVPMDLAPPYVGSCQVVNIQTFLKKGGGLIFGGGRGGVTSGIVINISGIKYFIDRQIKRALN